MERTNIREGDVLELSSVIEGAPAVMAEARGDYTSMYSARSKSSRSQNCTGTPCRSVPSKNYQTN